MVAFDNRIDVPFKRVEFAVGCFEDGGEAEEKRGSAKTDWVKWFRGRDILEGLLEKETTSGRCRL